MSRLKIFLIKVELFLYNIFFANPDEYYSLSEPSKEYMEKHNKLYWCQPIID